MILIFGINDGVRSLFLYNYILRKFDRCKKVYLWIMFIVLFYLIIVYVFVAVIVNNIWVWILNVDSDKIDGMVIFIRIILFRIFVVLLVINFLFVF